MQITTIGLDLAKSWFQVHGVDADGKVAVRRKLKRSDVISFFKSLPSCLVGIEACATAHYWAKAARFHPRSGWKTAGGPRTDGAWPRSKVDAARLR
jgi:transposase